MGQFRKGEAREPYIYHVEEVARLVYEFGGDEDAIVAAWLHDVVEDCEPTIDDICREFGSNIASIVAEVTDNKRDTSKKRKEAQVISASTKSEAACLIKWADKSSNLRAIGLSPPPWDDSRKNEYIAWAIRVTDKLPFKPSVAQAYFNESVALARLGSNVV